MVEKSVSKLHFLVEKSVVTTGILVLDSLRSIALIKMMAKAVAFLAKIHNNQNRLSKNINNRFDYRKDLSSFVGWAFGNKVD